MPFIYYLVSGPSLCLVCHSFIFLPFWPCVLFSGEVAIRITLWEARHLLDQQLSNVRLKRDGRQNASRMAQYLLHHI